ARCFSHDPRTSHVCTLSLHDALPIYRRIIRAMFIGIRPGARTRCSKCSMANSAKWRYSTSRAKKRAPPPSGLPAKPTCPEFRSRSEEHTSELQSLRQLVCRLLLEKKK